MEHHRSDGEIPECCGNPTSLDGPPLTCSSYKPFRSCCGMKWIAQRLWLLMWICMHPERGLRGLHIGSLMCFSRACQRGPCACGAVYVRECRCHFVWCDYGARRGRGEGCGVGRCVSEWKGHVAGCMFGFMQCHANHRSYVHPLICRTMTVM